MVKDSSALSIGVFIIVLALSIAAFAAGLITNLIQIVPLVLAFFGVWIMILAGINASKPQKYARSAFSTFSGGALIMAVGVVWLLSIEGYNIWYLISALLLILGLLVVVAVLRTRRK